MTNDLEKQMEKEVLELLYDKSFCETMGIKYSDIKIEDVYKVRNWVYEKYHPKDNPK